MAKFGKKNVIKEDIFSYNLGIIGESGIGKTTLVKEVCEKAAGEDGYIILEIGKEDGIDAIEGAVYEDVPNWKVFNEIVTDIVKNKDTDYPDLKVVAIDTIDQLFEICEPYVVALHNADAKPDKKVKTIKSAFGGFMAGEDKCIEIVLDKLWSLKKVGVSFIIIGHTKKRDIEDVVTGQTYSTLTTNMSQRYFNSIKTKLHVLGIASIDREIVKEKTGKKNIVTKKEEEKGKVLSESRKITFRDDNYTIDSKSRFADIIDEVPLDSDEFIKAIKDAINAAKGTTTTKAKTPTKAKVTEPVAEEPVEEIELEDEVVLEDEVEDVIEEEVVEDKDQLIVDAKALYKSADKETKSKIQAIVKQHGSSFNDVDVDGLKEIIALG